jgi:hypothetical protein
MDGGSLRCCYQSKGKHMTPTPKLRFERVETTYNAYRCGYEAGAAAEREACAKVCEDEEELRGHTPFDCALRIRARGEQA